MGGYVRALHEAKYIKKLQSVPTYNILRICKNGQNIPLYPKINVENTFFCVASIGLNTY